MAPVKGAATKATANSKEPARCRRYERDEAELPNFVSLCGERVGLTQFEGNEKFFTGK
jgi:hypothetical protein